MRNSWKVSDNLKEYQAKNGSWNKGRKTGPMPEEQKKKLSLIFKGRKPSLEQIKRLQELAKKRIGTKLSVEAIEKARQGHLKAKGGISLK